MKRFYLLLASVVALAIYTGSDFRAGAQSLELKAEANFVSTTLVISQVYGGGGGTGTYLFDYVELKNISGTSQSLSGLSVMYGSATGQFASSPTNAFALPDVTLQPGQYYLIQLGASGSSGSPLPVTPDVVTTNLSMSNSNGKVALTNGLAQNTCGATATPCALPNPQIVDLVSYGSANNAEGGSAINNGSPLTNTQGGVRKAAGCTDSDNNNADFEVVTAPIPRNTATTLSACNLGGNLQAGIAANPTTVNPGSNVLFTVSVVPATSPASTGIAVVGNLSEIGGSATQAFFDNGTNGDVTPGDNVFSYQSTIAADAAGGPRTITAQATDAQGRFVNLTQLITVNALPPNDDPLLFGNPSNATADVANENNYLMSRPQYSLSYNRSLATPNWVAWRLDSTWLGTTPRQDDYRADTSLPAGWYQVGAGDYSGSGYDRGHMCPSGDRTNSVPNNSATFLMTNFVPQLPANNQGPWEDFETYCRTIANQGNEIYIITGPSGNAGTISQGRIVVPQVTWKVVLILPNGTNDLQRVTRGTRAFGIIVPNQAPVDINAPWRNFRTTVDAVEALTGYNFNSAIPKNTQELIERRRDTQ